MPQPSDITKELPKINAKEKDKSDEKQVSEPAKQETKPIKCDHGDIDPSLVPALQNKIKMLEKELKNEKKKNERLQAKLKKTPTIVYCSA